MTDCTSIAIPGVLYSTRHGVINYMMMDSRTSNVYYYFKNAAFIGMKNLVNYLERFMGQVGGFSKCKREVDHFEVITEGLSL